MSHIAAVLGLEYPHPIMNKLWGHGDRSNRYIFSGGFCKTLEDKPNFLKNDHNALVTFTEKHWQMKETTMIWLTFVRQTFPGKLIGICYNYNPSHNNYILE